MQVDRQQPTACDRSHNAMRSGVGRPSRLTGDVGHFGGAVVDDGSNHHSDIVEAIEVGLVSAVPAHCATPSAT